MGAIQIVNKVKGEELLNYVSRLCIVSRHKAEEFEIGSRNAGNELKAEYYKGMAETLKSVETLVERKYVELMSRQGGGGVTAA